MKGTSSTVTTKQEVIPNKIAVKSIFVVSKCLESILEQPISTSSERTNCGTNNCNHKDYGSLLCVSTKECLNLVITYFMMAYDLFVCHKI